MRKRRHLLEMLQADHLFKASDERSLFCLFGKLEQLPIVPRAALGESALKLFIPAAVELDRYRSRRRLGSRSAQIGLTRIHVENLPFFVIRR